LAMSANHPDATKPNNDFARMGIKNPKGSILFVVAFGSCF
jgi:hypothetical protein